MFILDLSGALFEASGASVAGIRPAEENSDLELPSWVPDFRHPLGFIQHPGKMFSAADGNTAEVDVSNSQQY
jgi:hypothetical protein